MHFLSRLFLPHVAASTAGFHVRAPLHRRHVNGHAVLWPLNHVPRLNASAANRFHHREPRRGRTDGRTSPCTAHFPQSGLFPKGGVSGMALLGLGQGQNKNTKVKTKPRRSQERALDSAVRDLSSSVCPGGSLLQG